MSDPAPRVPYPPRIRFTRAQLCLGFREVKTFPGGSVSLEAYGDKLLVKHGTRNQIFTHLSAAQRAFDRIGN